MAKPVRYKEIYISVIGPRKPPGIPVRQPQVHFYGKTYTGSEFLVRVAQNPSVEGVALIFSALKETYV